MENADTYLVCYHDNEGTHNKMFGHTPLILELIGGAVHILVRENNITLEQALMEIKEVVEEYERQ